MTEMPKSVKVGPYTYAVSTDEAAIRKFEHEKQSRHAGHTSHSELAIHVDPHNAAGYQRDTLWHEVLHCIVNVVNLQPKLSEEEIICTISHMTLAVLRDNPDLVAYLTGDDPAAPASRVPDGWIEVDA